MKKLLLTTLSVAIGFGAIAQENLKLKNQGFPDSSKKPIKSRVKLSKASSEAWYNPLGILDNGGFKFYYSFMMNDSFARYINSEGVPSQRNTVQGVGNIIDPKDEAILIGDNPEIKMSKFNSYKVDSISFPYGYSRKVDSTLDGKGNKITIVDTLFVFYYSGSQIIKSPKQSWSNSMFGTFGYNYSLRRPSNYITTDTILLTSEFATPRTSTGGFEAGVISLAPKTEININANGGRNTNNLVGFSYLFKNGTVYDTSYTFEDRRDPSLIPSSTKWVNSFVYFVGINEGNPLPTNNYYNCSVFTGQINSYRDNNGWVGWVSGYAYENDQILNAEMKLSTENISVKEVPNLFSLKDAYPNPASNDVTIEFDLKSNKDVKISLVNLIGQEVISIANDKFTSGSHSVNFNVENLKAGVYFYTMTVDGVSQSQKIIIK